MHKSSAAILNLWHRARTRYLLPVTNCVQSMSCSIPALSLLSPCSAPALPYSAPDLPFFSPYSAPALPLLCLRFAPSLPLLCPCSLPLKSVPSASAPSILCYPPTTGQPTHMPSARTTQQNTTQHTTHSTQYSTQHSTQHNTTQHTTQHSTAHNSKPTFPVLTTLMLLNSAQLNRTTAPSATMHYSEHTLQRISPQLKCFFLLFPP